MNRHSSTPTQAKAAIQTNHLSEDQVAELLIGSEPGGAVREHLESCAFCRHEVAMFDEAVGDFKEASLAWSVARSVAPNAARSAVQPVRVPARAAAGSAFGWSGGWAWAAAAALVAGVTLPVVVHVEHRQAEASIHAPGDRVDDAANSPEQIARDNVLLVAVNVELSRSQNELAGLAAAQSGRSRRRRP